MLEIITSTQWQWGCYGVAAAFAVEAAIKIVQLIRTR